ncbi:hypothetical protein ABW19_dt0208201 [Dactylella cylindrospora]|nr:hypothetical protein ABW19_dt0208201 [Dactylella cylindrospora]
MFYFQPFRMFCFCRLFSPRKNFLSCELNMSWTRACQRLTCMILLKGAKQNASIDDDKESVSWVQVSWVARHLEGELPTADKRKKMGNSSLVSTTGVLRPTLFSDTAIRAFVS